MGKIQNLCVGDIITIKPLQDLKKSENVVKKMLKFSNTKGIVSYIDVFEGYVQCEGLDDWNWYEDMFDAPSKETKSLKTLQLYDTLIEDQVKFKRFKNGFLAIKNDSMIFINENQDL